jgi:E3 ubiquitin-protein ligase TRIP12
VAGFASSVLSSKDHPTLVLGALQLVEILLSKVPADYIPAFRREGVFHEIETIAARPLFSKAKDKDHKDGKDEKDLSAPQTPEPSSPPHPPSAPFATSTPGYKKLASLALEPEDAITLRARVIRFRHLTGGDQLDDGLYSTMQGLVEKLSNTTASEKDMLEALKELANLFSSPHTSVSSFELLQSGVVDALLEFTTSEGRSGIVIQFSTYKQLIIVPQRVFSDDRNCS